MAKVVARRFALAIPLLFVVSALTFVLVSLAPGDAATTILGVNGTKAQYAALRHQLHLDLPLWQQYWDWLKAALSGDLGRSLFTSEPVSSMIRERLPVTLSLVLSSLVAVALIGVVLGMLSAILGGRIGRFVDGISLVGYALPGFWIGAVLISLFAVKLHWLPAVGYVPLTHSPAQWLRSLALPIAALALHSVAVLAKQAREAMLDALASEHVRAAWANGIPPRYIYFVLALKTVAPRVVTILGLQTIGLLAGTLFIEQVFALPGLGSGLVSGASQGDLPVVQGITVFFAVIIVAVNLLVDLSYALLDPRIRTS